MHNRAHSRCKCAQQIGQKTTRVQDRVFGLFASNDRQICLKYRNANGPYERIIFLLFIGVTVDLLIRKNSASAHGSQSSGLSLSKRFSTTVIRTSHNRVPSPSPQTRPKQSTTQTIGTHSNSTLSAKNVHSRWNHQPAHRRSHRRTIRPANYRSCAQLSRTGTRQ